MPAVLAKPLRRLAVKTEFKKTKQSPLTFVDGWAVDETAGARREVYRHRCAYRAVRHWYATYRRPGAAIFNSHVKQDR